MTECIAQFTLGFHPAQKVDVAFDAPETSSDGGALLLREVDDRIGLSKWFSSCLPDDRDASRVEHDRLEQIRQRLYQIALGYEDCNDANHLRVDPLLKTACGRNPDDAIGLSSQPTLSRFENGVSWRAVNALLRRFEEEYVDSFAAAPETIILDIDSTDDPTHGAQQLTFFHGYYRTHMYHPLLVFDGQSGELVTAILRPGNVGAARGALGPLRRIILALKRRFPNVLIVVRGDAAFSAPRLLEMIEALDREVGGVDYLFGLAKNNVLLREGTHATAAANEKYQAGQKHVRHFASFLYATKETWTHRRLVVMKAERTEKGENPRFIVTSLDGFPPEMIYDAYCQRGQCENYIKDFKNALAADRLSCSRFVANFFRLLEHAAAYRLMHGLRTCVAKESPALGRTQFDTLRLRLLKVAASVSRSVRRILIRLPAAFPCAKIFRAIAAALEPPQFVAT
jgi:hypothetical protein